MQVIKGLDMSIKQQVVAVGNGMVGHHFVEQLSQLRSSSDETVAHLALHDETTYQD